ncbi:hypothetical protein PHYPSEUDO_002962 [Phytophthora pseudosyringae]|uniref:Uncharacterized protein n=1 Tax=Phytophthora pseudosyringae TaxID=221518 RepID=A0A8T1VSA8_9STRA|nr:hypothetical protein PHYPSEUDO_002962 [Phytophthora pseudosyringae]
MRVRFLTTQHANIGDGDSVSESDLGIAVYPIQQIPHRQYPAGVPAPPGSVITLPAAPLPSTPIRPVNQGPANVQGLPNAQATTSEISGPDDNRTDHPNTPRHPVGPGDNRTDHPSTPRSPVGGQQSPPTGHGYEDIMELMRMQMVQNQADECARREERQSRLDAKQHLWDKSSPTRRVRRLNKNTIEYKIHLRSPRSSYFNLSFSRGKVS